MDFSIYLQLKRRAKEYRGAFMYERFCAILNVKRMGIYMDADGAKRILMDLYNGINSLRVASALHIAIHAIDGVKLGVPEIEKYPRQRKCIPQIREKSGLRKTASALGNSGTRWTKEEKAMLIALYEQEESYERIGKELRRTPFEIQEKLEMMGYRCNRDD